MTGPNVDDAMQIDPTGPSCKLGDKLLITNKDTKPAKLVHSLCSACNSYSTELSS